MAGTQISQQRKATIVEGTVKYTITTTCTVPGTLQDTSIFLLSIVNTVDPKDDTFSRIIDIADIETYTNVRDDAIDNGDGSWRSSSVTITYTDIETANAAWKEFNSRINTLVNNYDTYLNEFNTFSGGAVISFPTVDESGKQALIDSYTATVSLVTDAQTAVTDHEIECTQLETDLATIEDRLQEAQADLLPLLNIQATVTAAQATDSVIYSTLNANNTQVRTLNATSAAEDSEKDAIEAVLTINDPQLSQFQIQNGALAALIGGDIALTVSTIQARISSLVQAKNSKHIELNKCHIESSKLEAAAATAISNREAALAAVVEVCPDYTP